MRSTETVILIPNGEHEIPATVCLPGGEGKFPAVVLLHGTGSSRDECMGAFQTVAKTFAEEYDIASIRIDFMGNGESKADYRGYTFASAVSDAVRAAVYMQGLQAIDPERIGVLGWSQGGLDALLCAARRPELFKSVVTWAGAADMRIDGIFDEKKYEEAKQNGYFVMDLGWRAPLNASLQWCEDVMHADVINEFAVGYTGPVLAIHGTEDTTVDPAWSEKIVAASKNNASRTFFIDGMDHTFKVFVEDDLHSLKTAITASGAFFSKTLK